MKRSSIFKSQAASRLITRSFPACLFWLVLGVTLAGLAAVQPLAEWGSKYATPGVMLTVSELRRDTKGGKTIVVYKLTTSGLPQDKVYTLWSKELGREAEAPWSGLRLDTSGNVLVEQSGKAGEFRLTLSEYARGEPLEVMLVSNDRTQRGYARIIPHPIEAKGSSCRLSAQVGSQRGDVFGILGEGFEPGEEVVTESRSNGEVVQSKQVIPTDGKFGVVVTPGVTGKQSGTASFTVTGKNCTVSLSYEWGPSALKPQ